MKNNSRDLRSFHFNAPKIGKQPLACERQSDFFACRSNLESAFLIRHLFETLMGQDSNASTGVKMRSMKIVSSLLCTAAIISSIPMQRAAAQNASSGDGVEEIIVTAQKREESLQKTPIAVTALTSSMLENRSINASEDLEGSIPNFQIEPVSANPSSVSLSMRGAFDETGAIETDESPVGIYIDGVYHARLAGATFQFTDIDRIEVLRGPQGTLYGRNTLAGAISIITKKPENEFWANAEVGGGSFGTIEAKGSIGGALVEDMLGGSVAVVSYNTDGYVYNRALNRQEGHQHDFSGHATLHLFGIENFDALFTISTVSNEDDGYEPIPLKGTPGALTEDAGLLQYTAGGPDVTQSPIQGHGDNEQWSGALNMSYDFGPAQLRSITGYTDLYDLFAGDFDGGLNPSPGVYSTGFFRHSNAHDEQFSQELQATGTAFDSRLSWIAGLYYFHEVGTQDYQDQIGFTPTFVFQVLPNLQDQITDGYAAYTQETYKLTDELSITAGLRFSNDQKVLHGAIENGFTFPQTYGFVNLNKDFHTITPHFGIDYQVTPDTLTYISVSEGFQSGGFNGLAVGAPQVLGTPYQDETVWSYETGVKTDVLDNRLRINAAFFYAIYYGLQEQAEINKATLSFADQNVGTASVYGLELEMTGVITHDLHASLNLGLQHDEYDGLNPASEAYQNHATELPLTPNYSGGISLDYDHAMDPAGNYRIIAGATVTAKGGERTDATAAIRVDSLTKLDLYAGTKLFQGQWDARLTVKNVTNDRTLLFGGLSATSSSIIEPPRTFIATLRYKY